jgi:hypothetical protein
VDTGKKISFRSISHTSDVSSNKTVTDKMNRHPMNSNVPLSEHEIEALWDSYRKLHGAVAENEQPSNWGTHQARVEAVQGLWGDETATIGVGAFVNKSNVQLGEFLGLLAGNHVPFLQAQLPDSGLSQS